MKTEKFTPCSEEYNEDLEKPLFYQTDANKIYLDTTGYFELVCSEDSGKNLEEFIEKFSFQIDSLCRSLGVARDEFLVRDGETGNIMIDERGEFMYLDYLDERFGSFMYARMRELFTYGFTVSDKVIASVAKERGLEI